jgi:hypothetical protein
MPSNFLFDELEDDGGRWYGSRGGGGCRGGGPDGDMDEYEHCAAEQLASVGKPPYLLRWEPHSASRNLPRCPVLNFTRDGDSISARPRAVTDTGKFFLFPTHVLTLVISPKKGGMGFSFGSSP